MRLKVSTYRNSSSLGVGPLATFQKNIIYEDPIPDSHLQSSSEMDSTGNHSTQTIECGNPCNHQKQYKQTLILLHAYLAIEPGIPVYAGKRVSSQTLVGRGKHRTHPMCNPDFHSESLTHPILDKIKDNYFKTFRLMSLSGETVLTWQIK